MQPLTLASIAAFTVLMACSTPVQAEDQVKTPVKAVTLDSSRLGSGLLEVAKLVQSGVNDTVVVAFIQNNPLHRSPTADELVHLHGLGLSSKAMVELINSVKKPSEKAQVVAAPTSPERAEPQAQPMRVSPPVVYTRPPVVYVERPVVDYVPYPRFSFGLNLGHHFGSHLFGHHGGGHHGFSFGHHGGRHH